MVAESAKTALKAPAKAQFHRGFTIPESIRLTVRSLYVLQGRGPAEIGPMVNLTPQQVKNLVGREGWTRLREKKLKARSEAIEARMDERAKADVERVVEAVAVRSEELSIRSLDLSSEFLDAKDAKSLQMASGAAMNFVKIARMSRGLDQRQGERNGSGDQLNVSVFLVRGETVESAVKRAEPVEVVATALPTS